MKKIKLTNGYEAVVDNEDYEVLKNYKWYTMNYPNTKYAATKIWLPKEKKGKTLRMHRAILGVIDSKIIVDHKNRNGLDNRKENLRISNRRKNAQNSYPRKNSSCKYKGVKVPTTNKNLFEVRITYQGEVIIIGKYKDPQKAALAYDKKAQELFGEFAALNSEFFDEIPELRSL